MNQTLKVLFVSLLIGVLMFGCTKKADIKAEIEAVRKADADWVKAVSERDIEHAMEFYVDDAEWLQPKIPIITGKDAIRKFWEGYFAGPDYGLTWKPIKVEFSQSGDLA